jgi:hypothetical protein
MNHTAITLRTKQGFIQRKSSESDCLSTFNLLTNDLLFDEVERLLPPHTVDVPLSVLLRHAVNTFPLIRNCR